MAKDKSKKEDVICEECGKRVPKARLKAVPHTKYCVKCADISGNEEPEREIPDGYDVNDLLDTISPDD